MQLMSEFEVSTLKRDLEALLFAAGDPITVESLQQALGCEADDGAQRDLVVAALRQIQTEFPPGGDRGFELAQLSGGWAFRTNPRLPRNRGQAVRAARRRHPPFVGRDGVPVGGRLSAARVTSPNR